MRKYKTVARHLGRTPAVILLGVVCGFGLMQQVGADEAKPLLRLADGLLSAEIDRRSLAEVANALEAVIDIRVRFQSSTARKQWVSRHFQGLAPRAAVRELLKDVNYAMLDKQTATGTQIVVHVYGPGTGKAKDVATAATDQRAATIADDGTTIQAPVPSPSTPNPMDLPAPPDPLVSDAAARILELRTAVATHGAQSIALVLEAANDPDAEVRSASAELLLDELREAAPQGDLTRLALSDKDPDIRVRALDALAQRESSWDQARMTLDGALHDDDQRVRQRAEELLAELLVHDQ
jgi:hypothetical protein